MRIVFLFLVVVLSGACGAGGLDVNGEWRLGWAILSPAEGTPELANCTCCAIPVARIFIDGERADWESDVGSGPPVMLHSSVTVFGAAVIIGAVEVPRIVNAPLPYGGPWDVSDARYTLDAGGMLVAPEMRVTSLPDNFECLWQPRLRSPDPV